MVLNRYPRNVHGFVLLSCPAFGPNMAQLRVYRVAESEALDIWLALDDQMLLGRGNLAVHVAPLEQIQVAVAERAQSEQVHHDAVRKIKGLCLYTVVLLPAVVECLKEVGCWRWMLAAAAAVVVMVVVVIGGKFEGRRRPLEWQDQPWGHHNHYAQALLALNLPDDGC